MLNVVFIQALFIISISQLLFTHIKLAEPIAEGQTVWACIGYRRYYSLFRHVNAVRMLHRSGTVHLESFIWSSSTFCQQSKVWQKSMGLCTGSELWLLSGSLSEFNYDQAFVLCVARWHSSRVPDLRSIGRVFESQPPRCQVQLWTLELLTHMCLCHQAV